MRAVILITEKKIIDAPNLTDFHHFNTAACFFPIKIRPFDPGGCAHRLFTFEKLETITLFADNKWGEFVQSELDHGPVFEKKIIRYSQLGVIFKVPAEQTMVLFLEQRANALESFGIGAYSLGQ